MKIDAKFEQLVKVGATSVCVAFSGAIATRSKQLRKSLQELKDICAVAGKEVKKEVHDSATKELLLGAASALEGKVLDNHKVQGLARKKLMDKIFKEFLQDTRGIEKATDSVHPCILQFVENKS